jgi:poly-gamma-glutamate synthesis protein (capsule biosynthesis protein)
MKLIKILFIICLALTMQASFAQKGKRISKFISDSETSYVKLMFVGDLPINKRVVESAYRSQTHSYDFQPIFHYIRPYLNLGDIVVGNLETTVGTPPYGKFPQYRSPKEIATSLKYACFNLLMTANGKSVYQDSETWGKQHEILAKVRILNIGSFSDIEDRFKNNPLIIEKK